MVPDVSKKFCSFETSAATHLTTRHHIAQEFKLQRYGSESLRCRDYVKLCCANSGKCDSAVVGACVAVDWFQMVHCIVTVLSVL